MKLRAFNRVLRQGESYRQVALDLMLTDPKIVHYWVVKYKNEGEESIKDTHVEVIMLLIVNVKL